MILFKDLSNTGASQLGRPVSLFTLVALGWAMMVLLLLYGEIIKALSYFQIL